ncbi:MAG: class I SAM-dependent methyltransferase [Candidatus Bathyarchaeota archaeon]
MSEWKEKIETMEHYDREAAIYNVQYLEEQNNKIEDIVNSIRFNQDDQVIDLGCGTGFLFDQISQNIKILVGIDLSINSLKEAKKRLKKSSNIALVRADADNIPFLNQFFDKIIAISLLQNMPNNLKTLEEMKRIAKSETVFAITGLKKKFSKASFLNLLGSANLNVIRLSTDQKLKGYVAICKNKNLTVDFI